MRTAGNQVLRAGAGVGARRRPALLATLVASVAILAVTPAGSVAATITVNSTGDAAADDGACILREAITSANLNAASGAMGGECAAGDVGGTDVVEFSLAGAGPHTIAPGSQLPNIFNGSVQIAGDTEPDEIRIDGAGSGATFGFNVQTEDVEIIDLSIVRYPIGVEFSSSSSTSGVSDSRIGTDENDTPALGNTSRGVVLGGTGNAVRDSVVSGQSTPGAQGISVSGDQAEVTGNLIGTDTAGTAALPNSTGISLALGADDAIIGGPGGDGNVISGNSGAGIFAQATTSTGTSAALIENNLIGLDETGTAALGNGADGITLRGNFPAPQIVDNAIAANGGDAIEMGVDGSQQAGTPAPSNAVISGNVIGAGIDGETLLANGGDGVSLAGSAANNPQTNVTVGGTTGITPGGACAGDCNLIVGAAGNGAGIVINGSTGTQVLGNHVGVGAGGTSDKGNGGAGVLISGGTANQVGSAAAPNTISGNGEAGVELRGATTSGNAVEGNLIGIGSDGAAAVGNAGPGVELSQLAFDNAVGGTAAGESNAIANNGGGGIAALATAGSGNSVLGNSIVSNAGLGIDLGNDGVTANDPGDGDAGPNGLQNFPELFAADAGASTEIGGRLDSAPSTDYRLQFFSNPGGADGTGSGEGEILLGSATVTTDADGDAVFDLVVAGTAGSGEAVSATATALGAGGAPGSTSEFSQNATEAACDVDGTAAAETLTATAPGDVLCGRGGNDTFESAGQANVVMLGGAGTDAADYSSATGPVTVDLGAGSAAANAGADELAGIESVVGSPAGDVITGDDAANTLTGGGGNDTVSGGEGNDTVGGGGGNDTVSGGSGNDTANGDSGDDAVTGGEGNDTVSGGDGNDVADGDAGTDTVSGGAGNDTADGGSGNDVSSGGDGADTVRGEDGDDTLNGDGGDDVVQGGNGSDTANGQAGADTVNGEAGNDSAFGGDGKDTLKGGDGADTLKGQNGNDKLFGGNGNDLLSGLGGFDTAVGHAGKDTLFGGAKKDTLKGLNGNDKLRGQNGNDILRGGNGKDNLLGQAGKDSLWGQKGKKDLCNGGGGRDKRKAKGCERVKKLP